MADVDCRTFLFVPVLAPEIGADALPPFAKLYHCVSDPLGKDAGVERLLRAVLKAEWDKAVKLIEEPFVGLRSMREERRTASSGVSRKSRSSSRSSVRIASSRSSPIAARASRRSPKPGSPPPSAAARSPTFLARARRPCLARRLDAAGVQIPRGLRKGVIHAAEKLGRPPDEVESLRERIIVSDPSKTAYALKCNIRPAQSVTTLLVVDQFEELLTQAPGAPAAPFVRLLLALADGDKDINILLTVRADYFNLISAIAGIAGEPVKGTDGKTLFERLTDTGRAAILPLKRISEAGPRDAIREPLRFAGHTDETAQVALTKAVGRDISHQPSDLPLMQVALRAAWRGHRATGIGLVEAYELVGGVLGALANEAEAARDRLARNDQARLESIFVRLVRLGDTSGATRRSARLDEFDQPRRTLLRKLGSDDYGRLVAVGAERLSFRTRRSSRNGPGFTTGRRRMRLTCVDLRG